MQHSVQPYAVVDLFAGPGGLGEGFEACKEAAETPRYRTVLSVEKDLHAHRTLRLRSFLRKFRPRFPSEYYDFLNDSFWTPYVGAGVGWAVTELSYYTQLTRKQDAEYLQIEFDPDWPEAAKRAAAGTTSILDAKAGKIVFGFQVLAGFDYALTERTSLGTKVRWTRFGDVVEDVTWTQVRSHAPVQAAGVTPFGSTLAFGGIGYQAVTVTLKHRF